MFTRYVQNHLPALFQIINLFKQKILLIFMVNAIYSFILKRYFEIKIEIKKLIIEETKVFLLKNYCSRFETNKNASPRRSAYLFILL